MGRRGRLRELLHIIPPGDLRKCLVALAEPGSLLAVAFEYRFGEEELAGHSLGNLVLAGLMDAAEDPIAALDEACRLLGVRGRVLPATTDPVVLKADAESGPVAGQVAVMGTDHIRHVSLVPDDPVAPAEAVEALATADQIILGPGSLFTSVLAAVAVPGIRDAIQQASAMRSTSATCAPSSPRQPTSTWPCTSMPWWPTESRSTWPCATHRASPSAGPPCRVVEAPLARPNGRGPRPRQTGVRPLRSARMSSCPVFLANFDTRPRQCASGRSRHGSHPRRIEVLPQ